MPLLDQLLTGGLLGQVKGIIGAFKLDPGKKAEFQAAIDQNAALLAQKQLELEAKIQEAISAEVKESAEIIKAEANSQSWLPRNVRPLLLLLWGCLITVNFLLPLIARFTGIIIEPLVLDPWVYRLTIIGYTGYVGFRSFEKIKDADK